MNDVFKKIAESTGCNWTAYADDAIVLRNNTRFKNDTGRDTGRDDLNLTKTNVDELKRMVND